MAFTLATFNVKDLFLAKNEDEAKVLSEKVSSIVGEIRKASADVVALQEIGGEEALAKVSKDLGHDYSAFMGTVDERGIGNAVLSRLAVVEHCVHTTNSLPFPDMTNDERSHVSLALRRGIVQVTVTTKGGARITILCAHLKSGLPRFLKSTRKDEIPKPFALGEAMVRSHVFRAAEALYIRKLVDEILERDPNAMVAVAGDLNDDKRSVAVRILRARGIVGELFPTWEKVPEHKRWSTLHGGRPSLIDHMLVTRSLSLALSSADIENETLSDHGPFVPGAPIRIDSDHALLWARFAVD